MYNAFVAPILTPMCPSASCLALGYGSESLTDVNCVRFMGFLFVSYPSIIASNIHSSDHALGGHLAERIRFEL